MTKIKIDSEIREFSGSIESYMVSIGLNPDSFLYLLNGTPIPMDTVLDDEQTVMAIRVASGG